MEHHIEYLGQDEVWIVAESPIGHRRWMIEYPLDKKFEIQHELGANCGAFELKAGCTGFVYGLAVADGLLRFGTMRNVLLVGAETLTKITNWKEVGGKDAPIIVITDAPASATRGLIKQVVMQG